MGDTPKNFHIPLPMQGYKRGEEIRLIHCRRQNDYGLNGFFYCPLKLKANASLHPKLILIAQVNVVQ